MPGSGFVYLVGAGPGDPRLLTLRAYELLRAAEVVAYDELVTPAILALIPRGVERLSVGHRHDDGHITYRLHPAVLERAQRGQTVVRLKCGDPFIFGRGGEEAEELVAAGVPYEVVPGVSAALGAAGYAGIPLTHRLHASAVTFATGHDGGGANATPGETMVLFMAARRLTENLERLIARGLPPSTPAAYVASATTPHQCVIVGTLTDLPQKVANADPLAPALLIVGDVVTLRERIAWFEHRPLAGRRVLVARARPGRSAIAAALRTLGAQVLEAPDIDVLPLKESSGIEAALARLCDFRGIVFGCAAGVDAVVQRAPTFDLPVIAIGVDAAQALARHGIEPTACVRGACLEALRECRALQGQHGRLLLVTSEEGRPSLKNHLAQIGVSVDTLVAYRHLRQMPTTPFPPLDLLVLPSSSAARAVLSSDFGQDLRAVPTVAIGPRTEEAARRYGVQHVVRAEEDSRSSLVSVAVAALRLEGRDRHVEGPRDL